MTHFILMFYKSNVQALKGVYVIDPTTGNSITFNYVLNGDSLFLFRGNIESVWLRT